MKDTAIAVLIGLGFAVGYIADARRRPYLPCRRCAGDKKSHSTIVNGAFGDCPTCGGTGRRDRPVTRLLGRWSS